MKPEQADTATQQEEEEEEKAEAVVLTTQHKATKQTIYIIRL